MKTFISTRNQFVNDEPVKPNDTVKADPERVAYLIARGFLVEVEEKPIRKNTSPKKDTRRKPQVNPEATSEQNDSNE